MKLNHLLTMAVTCVAVLCFAGQVDAAPITVNWTGFSDFDDDEITFAGFTADTLVSGAGTALFHDHGFNEVASIAVRLNGNWTTIASYPGPGDNSSQFFSALINNVGFASGTVDGLRFESAIGVGNTFHGFGDSSFTFDSITSTPEPISTSLLALTGLGGLGLRLRQRRKTQAAA
jgi:MYXO-CTERM domain-containing protein